MRPLLLFMGVLLCLAMQPPVESSLGHLPLPPIVGMKGEATPSHPGESHGSMDVEILKYAATQGGLTIVCIVMFFYARRDYTKRAREDRDDKKLLVDLVEKNTAALTQQTDSCNRMARALELQALR